MSSPWSTEGAATPRMLLERAHAELLAGNEHDPRLRDVRPLVRDSWRRSVSNLVGADAVPTLDLPGSTLEAYRSRHPLADALGLIRTLLHPDDDAGVIVAVGDAASRLLWIEGDRSVRSRVADMGFVEGANWAEDHVGTSAPGTALALGESVQVHGAEHFNRFVTPWSCTAAPVRDLQTGAL
ncbi:MAG: transcriptional regulator, partial [Microbacterium sp.]